MIRAIASPREPDKITEITSGVPPYGKTFEVCADLELGWKRIDVYVGPEHANARTSRKKNEWRSASQCGQDAVVRAIFAEPGFFVDLAANDAFWISNTYSLETYLNWEGICIEANEIYWKSHFVRRCHLVSGAISGVRDAKMNFTIGPPDMGWAGGLVAPDTDNADIDTTSSDVVEMYTVDIGEVFRHTVVPTVIHYCHLT